MKAYPWLTAALILAASSSAGAQKGGKAKPKPKACGIVAIPLAVGNQWIYEPVQFPWPKDADGNDIVMSPDQLKQMPSQPKKVTITVTDVQSTASGGGTVTLSEDIDGRVLTSTITCTQSSMTVSPESFFFAGEPGYAWNLELTNPERKGQSFPIGSGIISKNEWHDDFKATWKRTPTEGTDADLGSGTLELERHYVVTADESVAVAYNNYGGVHKIGLETHGRISVDGSEGKPTELPEGLVTWLWVADGTGIVKIANSFFQAYQLTGATIGK